LEDILHVPGWVNLILLGRWDATGAKYMGENGKITLTTKEGKTIAQGMKISNHLYKLKMVIQQALQTLMSHMSTKHLLGRVNFQIGRLGTNSLDISGIQDFKNYWTTN
jgi:hypothetical protein